MSKHLRGVKPAVHPDQEPLARVPKVPAWFGTYARDEWKRVLPVLVGRKVICAADLAQVETYCLMNGLVKQIEVERQLAGDFDRPQAVRRPEPGSADRPPDRRHPRAGPGEPGKDGFR